VPIVASSSELATQEEERWMHYSDCGWGWPGEGQESSPGPSTEGLAEGVGGGSSGTTRGPAGGSRSTSTELSAPPVGVDQADQQ
jgi:hypothetical protein